MIGSAPNIGTVVGNTSPQEFTFNLKRFTARLGDLVNVDIEIPTDDPSGRKQSVTVWGRITELQRFNPFLPAEAGNELADEDVDLLDTVLSNSRDQVEATVLVLGMTHSSNATQILPLNYPVQPGAIVSRPHEAAVKAILVGDEVDVPRLKIGTLIGRRSVEVSLKANVIVGRHMAILAMTGGGKTVAARRIIRELLALNYPLVILDPHGDYLGIWEKRNLFPDNTIQLYYPSVNVNDRNRDLISFLVSRMTQGFTDPQKDKFHEAMDATELKEGESVPVSKFIGRLLQQLANIPPAKHGGTIPAIKRGLRLVAKQMDAMQLSNSALRKRLAEYPFEPMPDPLTEPHKYVSPGQASIVYLGGYDHLTQSTLVALILKHLFENRASMSNKVPPFFTVVEEAHNFIPSRGDGQTETPSVEIIQKVITEGRKFGVGLLLISQRPSRLDETTLSQCNTFLVFRLVNPRDQSFVEKVMENLSKSDSRLLPGFGPGQGIISGQAVRFPLVVQVEFDDDLITKTIGDEDFVEAARIWKDSPQAAVTERSQTIEAALDEAERSTSAKD
jgi:DNA helicase HerA-like ATPase